MRTWSLKAAPDASSRQPSRYAWHFATPQLVLASLITSDRLPAAAFYKQRAAAVRRLAERPRLTLSQSEELARQIATYAEAGFSPPTRWCGVNLLTDAELAAYAGAAPLGASSVGLIRHRLNRGGNRRLNAVLYRIALA